MYSVHKDYQIQDKGIIWEVIQNHPFATIVSQQNGVPFANHMPVFLRQDIGENGELAAHCYKENTQVQHALDGQEFLIIFHGPHAYIPPEFDSNDQTLPTYAYVTVHAYGKPHLTQNKKELFEDLALTVKHFESSKNNGWNFSKAPKETLDSLADQIVGLRMPIDRFETQFKLVQDRGATRQKAIQEKLLELKDEQALKVAEWMEKTFHL